MKELTEKPIELKTLAHTGRTDGDDKGYRDVLVDTADLESPMPLVPLPDDLAYAPIYATGGQKGVCDYYRGEELYAGETIVVRRSVARALLKVNDVLKPYGREVLVVDGWRSAKTQAALWASIQRRILRERGINEAGLGILQFLEVGIAADDIGSFNRVVKNDTYKLAADIMCASPMWDDFETVAAKLQMTKEEVLDLLLTFQGNLGNLGLELDTKGTTAHGNGGAVDAYPWISSEDRAGCLGVPFDYVGDAARMDWFEGDNFDRYVELVSGDKALKEYLLECGIETVTKDAYAMIRRERRVLYHVMVNTGATIYFAEPWHFNFGNEHDDKPSTRYRGAGSGCHSLLKDIRNEQGEWIAAWGNESAHRMAAKMGSLKWTGVT